jgi:hypothetical protein
MSSRFAAFFFTGDFLLAFLPDAFGNPEPVEGFLAVVADAVVRIAFFFAISITF